jgi:glycosyltransferase involved in cell wall biosynthesis
MSSGLPVIAPALPRIAALVAHEREGILYPPSAADGIADALIRLRDPELRARLGAAARERAERDYSWDAHCQALETALLGGRR